MNFEYQYIVELFKIKKSYKNKTTFQMGKRVLLILFINLLVNLCATSQTKMNFVASYSTCEFPIYYKGNVDAIHLSQNNDTIKIVKYKHDILIEKLIDTFLITEYFKGESESARESISVYKFKLEDKLVFDSEKDYLNFSGIAKLLFMRENPGSKTLHLSIREYIGKKDVSSFGEIDSLFKFSIRFNETTENKNLIGRYFKVWEIPKIDIKLYCFRLAQTHESARFPPLHDGMQIPNELIGKPGYLEKYSKAYNYIFIKKDKSKVFNTIINLEEHESSSPIRKFRRMKRKGIYTLTKIDDWTFEKIKKSRIN